jgi:hypothetical protein
VSASVNDGLRLCRDCRWRRRSFMETLAFEPGQCGNHAVSPVKLDLATGKTPQDMTALRSARADYGACKPAGKFWEARS